MQGRSIDEKFDLQRMAISLTKHKKLTLRQLERIFALARIGLCEMSYNSKIFGDIYFFLAYLKVCETELFDGISRIDYSQQELMDRLEEMGKDIIKVESNQQSGRYPDYLNCTCHLMMCYEESIHNSVDRKYKPLKDKGDSSIKLNFKYSDADNGNNLLAHYAQNFNTVVDITHFTKKLELLTQFQA